MWTSDIRTSVPGPGSVSTSLARPSHLGRSNWTTSNAFPTLWRAFSISSCVISVLLPLGLDCGLDCATAADATSAIAHNGPNARTIVNMGPSVGGVTDTRLPAEKITPHRARRAPPNPHVSRHLPAPRP